MDNDSFNVHWFELKIKNPPRTWNKAQWKEVCHWLRASRTVIENTALSDVHKTFCDVLLNGFHKSC
jgi:hypothetical protein